MLYRQACEECSKGLGHGPLGSAGDVTNQTQATVMFENHIHQKTEKRVAYNVQHSDETLLQVSQIELVTQFCKYM